MPIEGKAVDHESCRVGFTTETRIEVRGNGLITVTQQVSASAALPALPRVGLSLTLPRELDQITFLGRGPWENYSNRKGAAHVGLYESTVSEQHYDYILPVECGGHEDTRWLELTDGNGTGLRVSGTERFS